MRALLCLIFMATFGCSKPESSVQAEQPPIPESEFVQLVLGFEHSPLTGRSEEIKEKIRAYLEWHDRHDTDPYSETNADRLHYVQSYWEAWKDPRRLDDDNGLYAHADQLNPGSGDALRARELQARFVEFNFAVPRDVALKDTPDFIGSWEGTREVWGPYDIDPIPWVLRHRKAVLEECETFNARLTAAEGWRGQLAVLDDFAKQKAAQAKALNQARTEAKEKLAKIERQRVDETLERIDADNRARAAASILSRERRLEGTLEGIERGVNSLNQKLR